MTAGGAIDSMTDDGTEAGRQTTPFQRMICTAGPQMGQWGRPPNVAATAAAAGVDPSVARGLFADDDALATAVIETVLVRLMAYVSSRTAGAPADQPEAQYRALVKAVIAWAVAHPDQGLVLLQQDLLHNRRPPYRRYGDALRDMGLSMLTRADAAGRLAPGLNPRQIEFATHAMTMGLLRLALSRPDDGFVEDHPDDPAAAVAGACMAAIEHHLNGIFR